MSELVSLITVPVGTRVVYKYQSEIGPVVIVGAKGDAVGEDSVESIALMSMLGNRNFTIKSDDGTVHVVSRYARVRVIQ
jgi:hypothetical protein